MPALPLYDSAPGGSSAEARIRLACFVEREHAGLRARIVARVRRSKLDMDPDDVYQESIVRAIASCHHLDSMDDSRLERWLLRIAANHLTSLARRRVDEPELGIPSTAEPRAGSTSTDESMGYAAYLELVWAVPVVHRAPLLLRQVFGFSWATVAFVLEKPTPDSARQQYLRAVRRATAERGRR